MTTIPRQNVVIRHAGPLAHIRCLGDRCPRIKDLDQPDIIRPDVEVMDLDKVDLADKSRLEDMREREIHKISPWWIIAIVVGIIVIIAIIIFILSYEYDKQATGQIEPNLFDRYVPLWGDVFDTKKLDVGKWTVRSMPGSENIDIPNCKHIERKNFVSTYNHDTYYSSYSYFSDDTDDDIDNCPEKTFLEESDDTGYKKRQKDIFFCETNNQIQVFTKNSHNISVKDNMLVIKAIREPTNITANRDGQVLEYISEFTSAQLVSRAEFSEGFFSVKVTLPNIQGVQPLIRLVPYTNLCMNISRTIYGIYPYCGQIDLVRRDPRSDHKFILCQSPWVVSKDDKYNHDQKTKTIIHGDSACTKLKTRKNHTQTSSHIISLEWTGKKFTWYKDSQVNNKGQITGGYVLHEVNINNLDAIDQDGRKLISPRPFDQLFNLVIELSIDSSVPDNVNDVKMLIDWVKVYQRPRRIVDFDPEATGEILGGSNVPV